MNILFNNPQLYVIDYPGHDALEILDKRNGRVGLLRGATAERMRSEFSQFLMQNHDQEEFEDFIDSYEAILDHCCEAWNKLAAQPWIIMSIGLRDWAHRF